MPVFAAPAFLLAGALAALVPLALHLIRRRPPVRAPLPTARFLVDDPRNAVRVSRPTDVPLLLLRMAMLVLLGAGLARPAWVPAPSGTVSVVLVDRALSPEGWRAAVGEARSAGGLVLFDTVAEVVGGERLSPAFFDSLAAAGPSEAAPDYAAGLRAIPAAVRGLRGADSVRVRLVSSFGGGWEAGLGPVRRAAWPGTVDLARVAGRAAVDSLAPAAGRRAVVVARQGGDYASAALGALGYEVSRVDGEEVDPGADVYVVLDPASTDRWTEAARGGATVVLASTASTGGAGAGGELWLDAGLRLTGAGPWTAPPPSPDRVVAVWEDGTPAAGARRIGTGCVVHLTTDLEAGELPFQAAYPAVLGRLARGCEEDAPTPGLDAGALALLRGSGPASVPAAAFDATETGTPLGRWLLVAALVVALAETGIAYRRRSA